MGQGWRRRGVCTDLWGLAPVAGRAFAARPVSPLLRWDLASARAAPIASQKSLAREPEGVARKAFWVAVGRFLLARKPRRPGCCIVHPGRKAIRLARKLRMLARDGSRVAFATRRVLRASRLACAWGAVACACCEKACARNALSVALKPNTSRATCAGLRPGISASRASRDRLRPGLRGLRLGRRLAPMPLPATRLTCSAPQPPACRPSPTPPRPPAKPSLAGPAPNANTPSSSAACPPAAADPRPSLPSRRSR